MNITHLFSFYAALRADYNRRPWAHSTKKGPGRKHQQGRAITKTERTALKD
jgi:hypothetical protein